MPHLVAAPDTLRGTATAAEVAMAVVRGAERAGWTATAVPLSDGGDGLLDVLGQLGGHLHRVRVSGPLGRPVPSGWLALEDTAVVEMARASGLALAGGPAGNDPLAASTAGTGELIVAARDSGPRRVVVGLGGSATTDGGWGALQVVERAGGMGDVELVGACDVTTTFVDAAPVFAPQKGASATQVETLEARLRMLSRRYRARYGIDVPRLAGTGAAGGLGAAILALGGRLEPGFDLVATLVGLSPALAPADLVVTAEGRLDGTSFSGKVVGQVLDRAAAAGLPSLVVAGEVEAGAGDRARRAGGRGGVAVVSLVERFGAGRARAGAPACVEDVVVRYLGGWPPAPGPGGPGRP